MGNGQWTMGDERKLAGHRADWREALVPGPTSVLCPPTSPHCPSSIADRPPHLPLKVYKSTVYGLRYGVARIR